MDKDVPKKIGELVSFKDKLRNEGGLEDYPIIDIGLKVKEGDMTIVSSKNGHLISLRQVSRKTE